MILTRQDLSDGHNVHDCAEEFRRAHDQLGPSRPFKLAEWALNWGEAAIAELRNPTPPEGVEDEEDFEAELVECEKERDKLKAAIETAVDALDDLSEAPSKAAIDPITANLEQALSE